MARRPPDRDKVKFPFGESRDDSGEGPADDARGEADSDLEGFDDSGSGSGSRDPVKFPFGDTQDPRGPKDRVKFPLGSSGDEAGESRSSAALPNLPPGARPDDDASLESLDGDASSEEEELVHVSDLVPTSDEQPLSRVSDLGPISPSGPLVIIDEEPDASSRYRASIVDDSARLAGSKDELPTVPRRGRKDASKGRSRAGRRGAADDDVAADAEDAGDEGARGRGARGSGARGGAAAAADLPPAPSAGRGAMLLRLVLVVGCVGAALVLGEVRRRSDLAAAEARHALALKTLQADLEATRRREQDAKEAVAGAEARARQDLARQAEEAARKAVDERDRAVADARRAGEEAGRAQAERAAREAIDVELARARAGQDEERAREVDAAANRAREEERARAEAALAETKAQEEARRRKELEALRKQLEGELTAMTSRAEEEAMARMLAEERAAALDRAEPAGGGSAAEPAASGGGGGGEWDSYFSGAGTGGAGGGDGEDPFAVGESTPHPVDRAWSWLKENLHGSIGYRNLSHFSRGPFRKTRHELRIKLDYRDWLWRSDDATKGVRLVSVLDVRVDDADYAAGGPRGLDDEERRRPIVWPEELHVDLNVDWLSVKAGWQLFGWGTGDLLNPTDVLNPVDFSDLFDTRRISVFATSVEASFEHISLELVSIPSFTRSRLPIANDRFDVLGGASPIPVRRPDDPESELQNAQWGARVVGHAGGWDVSLSAFTGWDDLPSPQLSLVSLAPLVIVVDPVFDRLHMVGADFATTLGFLGIDGALGHVLAGIQLHGEVAHFWLEGERQDDFVQAVVGVNYTWTDLILEHDLTLVLEYAGDATTHAAEEALPGLRLNRVLRGAVLARLEYAIDEELSFELNAAVITHGRENGLVHPGVNWTITDNLRLQVGGDVFFGPEETFFGQFKDDGRVIFDLKWVF